MPNREMLLKRPRKPLGFSLLRDVILRLSQNVETHYEYSYWEHPEKAMKNLIKPEQFLLFWTQFRIMHSGMIKKPLVFSLLATWKSAEPEDLIKPVENGGFWGLEAGPGGLRHLSGRNPLPSVCGNCHFWVAPN